MRRRPPLPTVLVAAALGLFLLYLALPNLGPAVRAAGDGGARGTFTARSLDCVSHPGHETCSWSGDFVPAEGGPALRGVHLAGSDRYSLRAGATTEARDVGRARRVYGPSGSREWIATALLALTGLGLTAFPLLRLASSATDHRALSRH